MTASTSQNDVFLIVVLPSIFTGCNGISLTPEYALLSIGLIGYFADKKMSRLETVLVKAVSLCFLLLFVLSSKIASTRFINKSLFKSLKKKGYVN
jgi:hypothetical protein